MVSEENPFGADKNGKNDVGVVWTPLQRLERGNTICNFIYINYKLDFCGVPSCRRPGGTSSLFIIHYSFFIRSQGASLWPCPNFGPLLFFSAE
ncbi:MAG TPA: hypothetical protein H9682_00790, partial [Firmicutes bacterium]|nr:hypothetical protein [Bacillota bacterium]